MNEHNIMVVERTHKGDRMWDPFSRLLKDRIVYLGTPVNDMVANVIMHSKHSEIKRCFNSQVKAAYIEAEVLGLIGRVMIDPKKIRECMDFFKEKGRAAQLKLERRLKEIEAKIEGIGMEKKRVLDVYASGHLTKDAYVRKSLGYDNEANRLKQQRSGLIARIPLLHKTSVIDTSIEQFCEAARVRFEKCAEFAEKRQFLLDYVEKIVCLNDKVTVYGAVPVQTKDQQNVETEAATIEFKIDGRIKRPSGRYS